MNKAPHNVWMFLNSVEPRLFYEGDEIPDGYLRKPSKFNGVEAAKFDHDGDGHPGGSLPAPKRRGRPPKVKTDEL